MNQTVALYDRFEAVFQGPSEGNPFSDITFSAVFTCCNRSLFTEGFYDGDGVYRMRMMPDAEGEWTYTTSSNCPALDGKSGRFTCIPPRPGVHGPVRVAGAPLAMGPMKLRQPTRFAYADGTPYSCVGTTCYAWLHQTEALQRETLQTLEGAPFNKLRMCIFPKHYDYNHNDPEEYPFPGSRAEGFDFARFNTRFFQRLEERVDRLAALGIEADLILFHPYDDWGFAKMPHAVDLRYLRYIVARLASFRNVWWSLANEWDMMDAKSVTDWDDFFRTIERFDPAEHMRSIHQFRIPYDHGKHWVTHVSFQGGDLTQMDKMIAEYQKPVVFDECGYEGTIPHPWGNLSGQELVRRMWEGFIRGGYVGHGEVFWNPEEVLWWAKGGSLHGESPERVRFLREAVEALPGIPQHSFFALTAMYPSLNVGEDYYLFYFGYAQPAFLPVRLPEGDYRAEVLDTWACTVQAVEGIFKGECRIPLPQKPYLALRIIKEK